MSSFATLTAIHTLSIASDPIPSLEEALSSVLSLKSPSDQNRLGRPRKQRENFIITAVLSLRGTPHYIKGEQAVRGSCHHPSISDPMSTKTIFILLLIFSLVTLVVVFVAVIPLHTVKMPSSIPPPLPSLNATFRPICLTMVIKILENMTFKLAILIYRHRPPRRWRS